ncbi:MAG: hypothetical protein CMD58_04755 [Gammaproteobacteria bacterium]|nr:hypothetical protein [Gammaproteobacteria bacterium]|tara:strand:- start:8790 stop:9929 length:1140 start_codon:yes stop_codon:yes gene_type:complete
MINNELTFFNSLKKVFRYISIYGFSKTWFKIIGRSRFLSKYYKPRLSSKRDIGVIGCGQLAFSTLGHSLCKKFNNRFIDCYDIDENAKNSYAKFYRIASPSDSAIDLIQNPDVEYVYITSNHFSHAEYAIKALNAGKNVYVEKPISVNYEQLNELSNAISSSNKKIYAGYNRPFSKPLMELKKQIEKKSGPITLSCFISAHDIPSDHWYRNEKEGSRICGNIGHWIDLAVHILNWGEMPDQLKISISPSNSKFSDQDLSITITSENEDLIVITFTSRCDPFEGVNESINFQNDNTICKIDDFRNISIWKNENLIKKSYWPKDVGHTEALLQPFREENQRDFNEVIMSTLLMLHIAEMVKLKKINSSFSFSRESNNFLKS